LAERSGLNVIDAFPARDLAQEGHGRPLLPIPHWILLHDSQKTRVLVTLGRTTRLTYLPGSRDASNASRIRFFRIKAFCSSSFGENCTLLCHDFSFFLTHSAT